jgi:hypothetical protein
MRMPNLSAEASLYPCRARYQLCSMLHGLRPGGKVVPATYKQTCDFDFIDPTKYCCEAEYRGNPHGGILNGLNQRCCSDVTNPVAGISCDYRYATISMMLPQCVMRASWCGDTQGYVQEGSCGTR